MRAAIPWLAAMALVLSFGSATVAQTAATTTAPQASADLAAQRASERVETRIETLRKRLAITPVQQPQWDAFAAVMRQNAHEIEATHDQNQPRRATGTALDELRAYTTRLHTHAANLDRLLPVFEALYTVLTPDQRRTADKTLRDQQNKPGTP